MKTILKFSSTPEDFHCFATSDGVFTISDGNEVPFAIKPSSGLIEIYYFIKLLIEEKSELSYCVEEYFTISQYDDEYCIKLKKGLNKVEDFLELKNNNHANSFTFDFHKLYCSLIECGYGMVKMYECLLEESHEMPFLALLINNLNTAKSVIKEKKYLY